MSVATRSRVTQVIGKGHCQAAEIAHLDTGMRRTVECDTVVFTGDWIPDHELVRTGGITLDEGALGPLVDTALRTSRTGVFAVGNLLHPVDTADVAALDGKHVAQQAINHLHGQPRPIRPSPQGDRQSGRRRHRPAVPSPGPQPPAAHSAFPRPPRRNLTHRGPGPHQSVAGAPRRAGRRPPATAQGPGYHDEIRRQIWGDRPQRVVLEQPDAEHILREVTGRVGIAVLDEHRARKLCPPGVRVRRFVEPVPTTTLVVAWRPRAGNAPVDRFIELCREHLGPAGR
ncbi:FAD-dependent oxidoreductase [Streptomyces sp. 11-1-2]|uniref:FAD-dependent oxidoreductase n=1 Tax=unclassified Streptomyces TaxID=2593676 RepID=UPI000B8D8256|nr:FAD-dependent oxidoreductase [Streptomyces sp. 11-1-2]ASQ91829.1 hypothetical protein CGL27_00160 [Streptomyces sp. 11-1-2]